MLALHHRAKVPTTRCGGRAHRGRRGRSLGSDDQGSPHLDRRSRPTGTTGCPRWCSRTWKRTGLRVCRCRQLGPRLARAHHDGGRVPLGAQALLEKRDPAVLDDQPAHVGAIASRAVPGGGSSPGKSAFMERGVTTAAVPTAGGGLHQVGSPAETTHDAVAGCVRERPRSGYVQDRRRSSGREVAVRANYSQSAPCLLPCMPWFSQAAGRPAC